MPVSRPDLGIARDGGLTHVLDKGLGIRGWEDVLETSGDYIDIVKLGWGTAYVTQNLERKLEVLREKRVVIGGTFFEVVYALMFPAWAIHLLQASLRRSGKRTEWDRFSGTIVRYRR